MAYDAAKRRLDSPGAAQPAAAEAKQQPSTPSGTEPAPPTKTIWQPNKSAAAAKGVPVEQQLVGALKSVGPAIDLVLGEAVDLKVGAVGVKLEAREATVRGKVGGATLDSSRGVELVKTGKMSINATLSGGQISLGTGMKLALAAGTELRTALTRAAFA